MSDDSPARFDVAVVGAGFAGMAAAVALAQGGRSVALVERRHTLGGRVHSHTDPQSGDVIDNGPHLFVGAYHHARRFLRALGTERHTAFQPRLELVMRDETGEMVLRRAALPGDLGLAAGLRRMRGVTLRDVWAARRLLPAARRADLNALDAISCDQWFRDLGVSPIVRRLFLDPICLAALNDAPERSSAALMARVLAQTFSGRRGDDGLGFIAVPHHDLFRGAVGPLLERADGSLIAGKRVSRVLLREGHATGVALTDGQEISADHVIVAVPHRHVAQLFEPEVVTDHRLFSEIAALGVVPIVNIHLWLDRPILDRPLVGLVGRITQWVFALDRIWPQAGTPHRVIGVISGATEAARWDRGALVEQMMSDLRALFPAAAEAQVVCSVVITEREATFAPAPRLLGKRPGPASPWPNLWWAGDWTATGLPSTIEGACQSGHAAAKAVLRSL